MATVKEDLNCLLDELNEDELRAVEAFAAFLAARRGPSRRGALTTARLHELRDRIGATRVVGSADDARWSADFGDGRLQPVDPVLVALYGAPDDDEPLTASEEDALEQGRAAARRGDAEPWEKIRANRPWLES